MTSFPWPSVSNLHSLHLVHLWQTQVACCCGSKTKETKTWIKQWNRYLVTVVNICSVTHNHANLSQVSTKYCNEERHQPSVKTAPVTFSSVCCYSQSGLHITVLRGAKWVWFALAASVWILHLSLSLSAHRWPGLLCRVLVRWLSAGLFCTRLFPLERQKSFAERLDMMLLLCVKTWWAAW